MFPSQVQDGALFRKRESGGEEDETGEDVDLTIRHTNQWTHNGVLPFSLSFFYNLSGRKRSNYLTQTRISHSIIYVTKFSIAQLNV